MPNPLKLAQAEPVLNQHSIYLASWGCTLWGEVGKNKEKLIIYSDLVVKGEEQNVLHLLVEVLTSCFCEHALNSTCLAEPG
jgi:hypothetical protein